MPTEMCWQNLSFYQNSTLPLIIQAQFLSFFLSYQSVCINSKFEIRLFLCVLKINFKTQPSTFISAVGNCRGFCRGKQCFYSNHLGKNIAKVIIS